MASGYVALATQAATGARRALCQAIVADDALLATGTATEPSRDGPGFASIGEDFQARKGLACEVVVARERWVVGHIGR